MNLIEYPDRDFLYLRAASAIASDLRAALAREERVSFAVPGGSTPGPVFDTLSGLALDWERVDVTLTDERWVPEDSDRSNARLVRRRLLTDKAAVAAFHPLWRDTPTPEEALEEVTASIAPLLPLSVLVLGMGDDMHTASIFPDADRLTEALAGSAPPLLPIRRTGEEERRITLTMPVLKDTMRSHLLLTGADKRAALERAAGLAPEDAPIEALLDEVTVHWAE